MIESEFSHQAKQAVAFSKEGLNHLVEVHELQLALLGQKKDEEYAKIVKEIVEREKLAVGLIQQATLIQRDLMKKQHEAIQKLIDTI